LRHLGEHPDVLDVPDRRVLDAGALGDGGGAVDSPRSGHFGLLHDVALLGPRRQQQVTSRLHGFIDQRVGKLLGLVEDAHGLVGGKFFRICPSLLNVCPSLRDLGA
jgi:hypothetical protein